jgi:exopolyphosphatase/guanosine-5'-triphosphate,3'-diphosphate pyrophosphatase
MWRRHHGGMPLGVIDVGSNTVRLLVVRDGREVISQREMLRLGASVERFGHIPEYKLREVVGVVSELADAGRAAGAQEIEILITSPGRQAENGEDLLDSLAEASGCTAVILSAREEGLLAFKGALAVASPPAGRRVAVVDVGGGSAQVVVGTRRGGAEWSRSIDLGSQRLTSRLLADDPPGAPAVTAARAEVERYLVDLDPPHPRAALVVGGSARALKRLAGSRLGADELERLITLLSTTSSEQLVAGHGVDPDRVRTMTAGALILAGIQRRLGTPLKVVRAGLREGALLELQARRAAA